MIGKQLIGNQTRKARRPSALGPIARAAAPGARPPASSRRIAGARTPPGGVPRPTYVTPLTEASRPFGEVR